jgi:glucoamylase
MSMKQIVVLAAATTLSIVSADTCSSVATSDKVDCGQVGSTQSTCEASGCCWSPDNSGGNVPWCFYKKGQNPSCPIAYTSKGAPFSDSEVATMRSFFLKNINIDGSGAVVAAPDYDTPGGSYYYHWERDGALSMGALLSTAASIDDVRTQMDAYVGWVSRVQQEIDPHGQSVLAEPKYMIPNGSVYAGGWCRPQNDGPGLRSKTLIEYAKVLMQEEKDDQANVTSSLKTRSSYTSADLWTLIQIDLDWQAANWQATGCDLWEEVRSDDFFWNRYTMRAALTIGSDFAKSQGDSARASSYAAAASKVTASLDAHYQDGYVQEASIRTKDAATICAFNGKITCVSFLQFYFSYHYYFYYSNGLFLKIFVISLLRVYLFIDGYLNDGVYGPTTKEVAGTVSTLNELFCDMFQINQDDTKNGIPGILYGRYEGDSYAGGNPWILLSSALAEVLYRGASEMLTMSTENLNSEDMAAWAKVLDIHYNGDAAEEISPQAMATAFAGAGDGVLTRIYHHVSGDNGFHLTEQISRSTGKTMAAHDLTWSYAATLKAIHARSTYVAALKK